MSKMIGEFTESHLLNVAKGVVEKKTADSVLLDTSAEGRIPKFNLKGNAMKKLLFGYYAASPCLLMDKLLY